MQKTIKSFGSLAAVVLSLSIVGACADVVTLRVAWQVVAAGTNQWGAAINQVVLTPKSPKIKLGPNLTAKVLHFYCVETNEFSQWSGRFVDCRKLTDSVKLNAHFGDLQAVGYYNSTINGRLVSGSGGLNSLAYGFQPGAGLPAVVGPATLELLPGDVPELDSMSTAPPGTAGMTICTIEVSGTAVVLPGENAAQPPQTNPVEVKLETSVDTEETWQPATLGRYDAMDQKRFFRLKIDKAE